ncbi:hypothetical protein FKM82_001191 [Ascaphus truei]
MLVKEISNKCKDSFCTTLETLPVKECYEPRDLGVMYQSPCCKIEANKLHYIPQNSKSNCIILDFFSPTVNLVQLLCSSNVLQPRDFETIPPVSYRVLID